MTDQNTPSNSLGPIWLVLVPSALSTLSQLADGSADLKRMAENLGVAWTLPYLAYYGTALAILGGAAWLFRRKVGQGRPWALWLASKLPRMPWDRSRRNPA